MFHKYMYIMLFIDENFFKIHFVFNEILVIFILIYIYYEVNNIDTSQASDIDSGTGRPS